MRYLLHDVFIESVRKNPSKIAIYQENNREITYFELNKLANQFANKIKQCKSCIRQFPFVGILSTVTINSIAAILGALKIGCAYVPLDENSPVERLKSIIKNTNLDVIIISPCFYELFYDLLQESCIRNIFFTDFCNIKHNLAISFNDILATSHIEPKTKNQVCDDLAYILHSSGSTGVPKGIMLSHRNARTFVDWMHKEFSVTEKDIIISRAPFKFDLSVFDIFNTFKAGAKLICFDWHKKRKKEKKHSDYVSLMCDQNVTILYTTPSTFITLINKGHLHRAKNYLRQIMYAGEPFPISQLIALKKCLQKTKIANIYGPSETNIITYFWINDINENDKAIPLGKEVDDIEILVVTEDGKRICEPGEIGELWCRGGTVTLGYLGDKESTAKCLVNSPFHAYPAKFWRTGDYGYRDKTGCLHYKGRRDHMVKVKGFRIELGEIESFLARISQLEEFCVVAVPDKKYSNRLYCFYSVLNGQKFTPTQIIKFLSQKLPDYMIPFQFIQQAYLIKNSAGKIDRIALRDYAQNSLKGGFE